MAGVASGKRGAVVQRRRGDHGIGAFDRSSGAVGQATELTASLGDLFIEWKDATDERVLKVFQKATEPPRPLMPVRQPRQTVDQLVEDDGWDGRTRLEPSEPRLDRRIRPRAGEFG